MPSRLPTASLQTCTCSSFLLILQEDRSICSDTTGILRCCICYQKEQHQHRAWDAFFFTMPQPPIILLMRKRLHKETKSRERESLSHKSLDNSSVLSNFAFITVSCIKLIFSMLALTKIQLFFYEKLLCFTAFLGVWETLVSSWTKHAHVTTN